MYSYLSYAVAAGNGTFLLTNNSAMWLLIQRPKTSAHSLNGNVTKDLKLRRAMNMDHCDRPPDQPPVNFVSEYKNRHTDTDKHCTEANLAQLIKHRISDCCKNASGRHVNQ